jgi:hypothetical protein
MEPLIRVKDDTIPNAIGRNYRKIQYKYTCQECGTNEFTNIKESITQSYDRPFKIGNDKHHHDYNTGNAILTCCNGHQTSQMYTAACECGWNTPAASSCGS